MADETNLAALERLTKKLNEPGPDVVWPLKCGKKAEVFRLWRRKDAGVALCNIESGVEFPRHVHDEIETIVVLRGKLALRRHGAKDPPALADIDGKGDVTLGPGAAAMLEVGTPHSVEALDEDALIVVVTIPASEVIHGKK
jgi:quercetin dioxygenase-like cupin family protein